MATTFAFLGCAAEELGDVVGDFGEGLVAEFPGLVEVVPLLEAFALVADGPGVLPAVTRARDCKRRAGRVKR
ncbi:MAG TPA: hypothetical protein VGJ20_27480 [Xanthobacteraceae bacterium]